MKYRLAILALAGLYFGFPPGHAGVTAAREVPSSGAPGASGAGGGSGAPGASLFQYLDADRSGFITPSEAKRSAAVAVHWKSLDVDRDHRLSPDELDAVR